MVTDLMRGMLFIPVAWYVAEHTLCSNISLLLEQVVPISAVKQLLVSNNFEVGAL